MRPTAARLLLALLLFSPMVPIPSAVAATTDAGDVRSALEQARLDIHAVRIGTAPTTRILVEDYADDVVAAIEDAQNEYEDLTDDPQDETAALGFEHWLLWEEITAALDNLEEQSLEREQNAYERAREDILDAADGLDRASVWTLRPNGINDRCPAWTIGTTVFGNDDAANLIERVEEELNDIATHATSLSTLEQFVLRRRIRVASWSADLALMSLWRLDTNAQDDREQDITDLLAALTKIDTNLRSSLGSTFPTEIGKLKANIEDHRILLDDEDGEKFGSTWQDDQEARFDALLERLEELRAPFTDTGSDGLLARARSATTVARQLEVRSDAFLYMHIASTAALGYFVPLSESQANDLTDVLQDIDDGMDDVRNELEAFAPSSYRDELDTEFEDLYGESGDSGLVDIGEVLGLTDTWFDDMPPQSDFSGAISVLSAYNVVKGAYPGRFDPYRSVTRFEFSKMLFRSACANVGIFANPDVADDVFAAFTDRASISSDVSGTMALAVSDGVLRGNAGKLEPNRAVTRFEAAKILVTFYGVPQNAAKGTAFKDVTGGEVAGYVGGAVEAGFFNAASGGNAFRPNDPLSRAEAAKILFHALVMEGDSLTTLEDVDVEESIFSELL